MSGIFTIPAYLSNNSTKWVKDILKDFEFNSYEIPLLFEAAECLDKLAIIRKNLRKTGLTYKDSSLYPKPHPYVKMEHDTSIRFMNICKTLNIIEKAR